MARVRRRHRAALFVCFLIYLAALGYFLFFAESFGRQDSGDYRFNLELFREIRRFYQHREALGFQAFAVNIVGNIIAFVPFGFLLPFLFGKRCGVLPILVLGAFFSFCIETVQYYTRLGSFDVDDILLNTAGCLLGYILFRLVLILLERR